MRRLLAVLLVLAGLATGAHLSTARAQEATDLGMHALPPSMQSALSDDAPRYSPSTRSGRQAVQELAAAHFPPDWVAWAVRVAGCESSLNPNADSNRPYVGLWQIDPGLHGWRVLRIFGRSRSLYEPDVNAAVAADILADQGPGAWPVCRDTGGDW